MDRTHGYGLAVQLVRVASDISQSIYSKLDVADAVQIGLAPVQRLQALKVMRKTCTSLPGFYEDEVEDAYENSDQAARFHAQR